MDARTLYRQGVDAIRDERDLEKGRQLLSESLKLNPNSDLAWLWLSRTYVDNLKRRLYCLEKAVHLNPDNAKARELLERLQPSQEIVGADGELRQVVPPTIPAPSREQKQQIIVLLRKADQLLEKDDAEAAIECWVEVLSVQVDHETAMRNAVMHLSKLGYISDAKELVWRAINAGTQHPSIYLTAMDIAKHDKDADLYDELRQKVVQLPEADETLIARMIDEYLANLQYDQAHDILKSAVARHPDNQKMLVQMGDLMKKMGRPGEATFFLERAAQLGLRSKEGREADKLLSQSAPVLTDRERGSVVMAAREAAGFGVAYLLLAWQDAGLDLLNMGVGHWLGVLLSLAGGYLLITATSSPQQVPIAGMLGGEEPPKRKGKEKLPIRKQASGALEEQTELPTIPEPMRYVLGGVGGMLLVVAFTLVFSESIGLLLDPVTPDLSLMFELLAEE